MMTKEQREVFISKWVFRFGRVCIATLIIYYALVLNSALNANNAIGIGYAFGYLIIHVLFAVSFMQVPEKSEVRVEHHYHHVHTRSMPRGNYVYVIKDIEISGFYKIGRTNEPYVRLSTFDVKLPFAIEVITVLQCKNAVHTETALHRTFAHKRHKGEWFRLEDVDIEYIKGLSQ